MTHILPPLEHFTHVYPGMVRLAKGADVQYMMCGKLKVSPTVKGKLRSSEWVCASSHQPAIASSHLPTYSNARPRGYQHAHVPSTQTCHTCDQHSSTQELRVQHKVTCTDVRTPEQLQALRSADEYIALLEGSDQPADTRTTKAAQVAQSINTVSQLL